VKNPITAKLLITRKAHRCECCGKRLRAGSKVWRELNTDLSGDERGPFYFCIQCDGEDETRKEQRAALNWHLASDG
jgi:hypothetical protein